MKKLRKIILRWLLTTRVFLYFSKSLKQKFTAKEKRNSPSTAWIELHWKLYEEKSRVLVGGQKPRIHCSNCGTGFTRHIYLSVDHIVPLSKGGSSSKSNLQVLCFNCNKTKADRIIKKVTPEKLFIERLKSFLGL